MLVITNRSGWLLELLTELTKSDTHAHDQVVLEPVCNYRHSVCHLELILSPRWEFSSTWPIARKGRICRPGLLQTKRLHLCRDFPLQTASAPNIVLLQMRPARRSPSSKNSLRWDRLCKKWQFLPCCAYQQKQVIMPDKSGRFYC